jgi:hypothetical protein
MIHIHPHVREHLFYYTIMVVLQIIGFFIVLKAAPDTQLEMFFVILTSGVYLFWALLHQYIHHSLHPKIVLEYVLVGFLGISVSFFMFVLQK